MDSTMDIDVTPPAPSASPSTTTITTLPVELQHKIMGLLPCEDLAAMRLTCRQADNVLLNHFTRRYFYKKQFYISSESLNALVGIASTPRLGPAMVHLIIGLDYYDQPNSRFRSSSAEHLRKPDVAAFDSFHRRAYDQRALMSTGGARDLLELAFSRLPNLKTVEIRDYNAPHRDGDPRRIWTSYGATTARRETCSNQPSYLTDTIALQDVSSQWASDVLTLAMSALARSGNTTVTKIEVNTRTPNGAVDGETFAVPPVLAPVMEPLFGRLTDVFLHVKLIERSFLGNSLARAPPPISTSPIMKPVYYWNLCIFLTKLTALRRLRFNFASPSPYFSIPYFLTWLAETKQPEQQPSLTGASASASAAVRRHTILELPPPITVPLERLELGHTALTHGVLLALVRKFRASLKGLSLHRVFLAPHRDPRAIPAVQHLLMSPRDDGERRANLWTDLFVDLAHIEDLALSDILLSKLSQPYGPTKHSVLFDDDNQSVKFHGEDWRDWLVAINAEMAKNWPKPFTLVDDDDSQPGEDDAEDNEDEDEDQDEDEELDNAEVDDELDDADAGSDSTDDQD